MLTRRTFLRQSGTVLMGGLLLPGRKPGPGASVMTVNGPLGAGQLGFTLTHEHVMVDFIGADKTSPDRYQAEDVFNTALPVLRSAKERGCAAFVDCTPAYLGRNVQLLQRLAAASGLHILSNTGYYGAAKEKYLPAHVYTETAEQLAARWVAEWEQGIEGTGIRPGFIKTGTDKAPLTPAQQKIIAAAAIAHLATGLTIGVHTGNGAAAVEQLEIIQKHGALPSAKIWIHAQSEPDAAYHVAAARAGGWVSFDGVSPSSITTHITCLQNMKREGLLKQVLVSHDAGWYHVGEPQGGHFRDYNCIFDTFMPAMRQHGFTQQEINTVFVENPARAFATGVRKSS
ncbi:phosphotriesterase family protein [Chitinophaga alhagiae]|uniref:phosphotriesterase family protein n=1 Tax=Chitinophaga alhagiae TaxID=2203219 RepID=UPI000E5AA609|nr:phosphotriesterase [Chitinophaga alhagiae]